MKIYTHKKTMHKRENEKKNKQQKATLKLRLEIVNVL